MRFSEIRVDRCGAWRELTLDQLAPGVNVVHGPNEAGKSTLLAFIRGVLYGFPPTTADGTLERARQNPIEIERGGSLVLEDGGERFEVARIDAGNGPGLVGVRRLSNGSSDVSFFDDERPDAERLNDLLRGADAALFEHVFAIGLHELQELATLEDDEAVARHIYESMLGPAGRRLLDASQAIDAARRKLFDPDTDSGRVVELVRKHAELSARIAECGGRRAEHAESTAERFRFDRKIESLKRQRIDLHRQLRGHLFLDRAHAPWRQVRELKAELAEVPHLADFPEDGLARLDELESEIDSATRCRDVLRAESAEFRAEAAELRPDASLARHAGTLRGLVASRTWIVGLEESVGQAEAAIDDARTELQDALAEAGPEWDAARLEREDISPTLLPELLGAARRYQASLVRRGRLRKRRRRLSAAVQRRTVENEQRLAALGGDTIDQAFAKAKRRLADLEDLGRLEARRAEFEHRRSGMELELARLDDHPHVPRWVSGVLGFFGVAGLAFLALGVVTGVATSAVAGLAYALLGLTCGGMAWALHRHFQRETSERREDLRHAIRENDERLGETREVIGRIEREAAPRGTEGGSHAGADSLIAAQTRRVAEIERIAASIAGTRRMRDRLTDLRGRHRAALRDASDARQAWCAALRRAGLTETVNIDEGFAAAARLIAARDAVANLRTLRHTLERDRSASNEVRGRMEHAGKQVGLWNPRAPLGEVLDGWERSLLELRRQRKERRKLLRETRKRRKEARQYARRIDEAAARRSALLVRGGAATRDEFEERAELVVRRKELEELLELADEDLAIAIRTEPDLAIVDEDLAAFDPAENGERITALNGQLAHLEEELEAAHEELGAVKQRLHELAADRSASRLRLEREQTATALHGAVEEWLGALLAARTLGRMCREFERTHQPATLRSASRYFAAFTEGAFETVWAPLGECRLLVDDAAGSTRSVGELSGGTREQLLLAVRLAVADRLAKAGTTLPLVLDDVFVNFDRQRTAAAVRTLIEFAGNDRQVIVFTCHEHLAEEFQRRGIEPLRLSEHAQKSERRRAG
ncbi:MAG: AAA family ATPase [Planctomycetaceae bacterium]